MSPDQRIDPSIACDPHRRRPFQISRPAVEIQAAFDSSRICFQDAALGWALLVCQLIPSDALARSRHIDAEAGDVRFHSFQHLRIKRNKLPKSRLAQCRRRIIRIMTGHGRLQGPIVPILARCLRELSAEKFSSDRSTPTTHCIRSGLEMARRRSNYPIAHLRERKLIPSTTRRCEGRRCFACANRLLQVHIQFFLSGFVCTRTLS